MNDASKLPQNKHGETHLEEGMKRIFTAVSEYGPELCRSYEGVSETAVNIQSAFAESGYSLSLGQAEEVYAFYSHGKWASWLIGGCPTLDDAKKMLIEFTTDILVGENHAEL
ncbi:hypothetical protein [Pseudomonas sp. AB6]|uniref:hypothetical protein n=1 Tax=Pseudomonas sp. AB6 TaxID=3048598 RepID=UPI002AB3EE4C|nr:hypothetical protein [Pseudomonas sp. AB6]MDY7563464.1 hypothetical protein [Pseudomonas sp. AB6]MEB0213471.1 hypothetical protein [Pseudomonas sp. AB6]